MRNMNERQKEKLKVIILKYLKDGNVIKYSGNSLINEFEGYTDKEIMDCVTQMGSDGYFSGSPLPDGLNLGVMSEKADKLIEESGCLGKAKKNWIALLAIIISLASLVVAIISLLFDILQK